MSRPLGSNYFAVLMKVLEAVAMTAKGFPQSAISKKLGVSKRMVNYYLRRWEREGETITEIVRESKEIFTDKK